MRLVSGNIAAPWLDEARLLRVGIIVELPRVPVIFRRTPVNPATGARTRGNREGRRIARVRACVPGPAGVRARSGGPYRRRPLSGGAATVWSSGFDTENTLKNFGNAVSCDGPIAVGFRAMGHSKQGLQLFYLSNLQKSKFVYLEFSKYFSVTNARLHGSLGSWLPWSSSKLG